MKYAIISDIHSNSFALKSVIKDIEKEKIKNYIILGDIFGYYPWAPETYKIIKNLTDKIIKGNHDELLIKKNVPQPEPAYWHVIKHNENSLKTECDKSLEWVKSLKCEMFITIKDIKIKLFHGTPDNPLNGRYYPDDENHYNWFPGKNEIVLLGHTHYPMIKKCKSGGLIVNPGSVGQPRDGNIFPSWCVLNLDTMNVEIKRTCYDISKVINKLHELNWDKRCILALQKNYSGPLKMK